MTKHIKIFDTTLRDGEQAPGFSMTAGQKLRLAKTLESLGVDIIEAGFAAASPGDFDAVNTIAEEIKNSTICSLARCNDKDIIASGEAIKPAASGRIHTFIATSPLHREYKLKMSKDEIVRRAIAGVELARTYTDDVEFSAEDAHPHGARLPETRRRSRHKSRRLDHQYSRYGGLYNAGGNTGSFHLFDNPNRRCRQRDVFCPLP